MTELDVAFRELREFRDASVPKLDNLRRAAAKGLRVPVTRWALATDIGEREQRPPRFVDFPLIVRSGSPTEDTHETSNAGQLLSLVARGPDEFRDALARVASALPRDERGRPRGAVFVQPLVRAQEAGVAFFDGFYFERTQAAGGNDALTSGKARGDVTRGHLARGDAWSDFLSRVYDVFGRESQAIDVEFARGDDGYVLLQTRPALFAVARNPTLSLANHKEILGDPPSPWIASVLGDAGESVLSFFAAIDPAVAGWGERYAVVVAERAWMNFSFFFRLMDRWGLPRSLVTRGVGGAGGGPADARPLLGRFAASALTLTRLQLASLAAVRRAPAALAELDLVIEDSDDLKAIYDANVRAMGLAIRTNFAINTVLSGVAQARAALGATGTARVVTQVMMERYGALAAVPAGAPRERALDAWLGEFGHRGPLESDPARPRFAELRDVLLRDLDAAGAAEGAQRDATPAGDVAALDDDGGGPLFWIDRRREWFRDELMHRWAKLRARSREAGARLVDAGAIEAVDDVFWLRGDQVASPTAALVRDAKARVAAAAALRLPLTASRDVIDRAVASADTQHRRSAGQRVFSGIALSAAVVEGTVVKARDLTKLLAAQADLDAVARLGADTILVVDALEPSWAVVFGRVKGVVAEIGGELSHASILLREAKKPAIVNCEGIFDELTTGMRVRLDGERAVVEILS